jgi:hypothetical protein
MRLAQFVMARVKQSLTTQMDYYSLTTDIWSSRVMKSWLRVPGTSTPSECRVVTL